ncbi:MAG: DUF5596 domain-containing protein [Eubacterium sp.]|nr:DUF5596 domain-containing protein [Eubacterium sp.]
MERKKLYKILEIPEEVVLELEEYEQREQKKFPVDMKRLYSDRKYRDELHEHIQAFVGEDTKGFGMLWEELNIASRTYDEYEKMGIDETIFIDTMKFCTRFLHEHKKNQGDFRFVWGWWFPRQLAMDEFRIGSLEFEKTESMISIHIPGDADLSPDAVQKSIASFRTFCETYFPSWCGLPLHCESWLLSPVLKELLDEHSNIIQFQNLFEVEQTDYDSMAVLDWVFPGYREVTEVLPEKTSLQKKMKNYLLAGNKVGWSTGTISNSK